MHKMRPHSALHPMRNVRAKGESLLSGRSHTGRRDPGGIAKALCDGGDLQRRDAARAASERRGGTSHENE